MKRDVETALPALWGTEPSDTKNIDSYTAIGIATSIYAAHWQYESWQVQLWLKRVTPFFEHQQVHLFLTQDHAPYGLATWLLANNSLHQRLLSNANWQTLEPLLTGDTWSSQNIEKSHLWLIDFVTPFSHALDATNALQDQFPQHPCAWALNQNPDQHLARQVW